MWQLLVHSDEDVRDFAGGAVRAALGESGSKILDAGNLHKARENFTAWHSPSDPCNLVILGARTPATRTDSVGNASREPVVTFIRELKERWPKLPVVLLSATPDEALNLFVTAFSATALVEFDSDWRDTLRERVADLVAGGKRPHAGAWLDVDIILAGAARASWVLRRRGHDPFREAGALDVEDQGLDRLVRLSRFLEKSVAAGGWQDELDYLSRELTTLIFSRSGHNERFWRKFVHHRERVGGVENTRVRVTLNDETHPVVVEALKDEDDPPSRYWMLRAPIFRRYDSATSHQPLFKDEESREGPVDFLVIDADPRPGYVSDPEWSGNFAILTETEREAGAICNSLKAFAAPNRGVVERLSIGTIDGDPVRVVLDKLNERRWHGVHFAGHAAKSATGESGLVLAAARGGVLKISDFANKLSGTQFLFLNSCRSANTYNVMRAIENRVPAILGFRWPVSDRRGADFAIAFYQAFCERKSTGYRYLEYAFMLARKAMHDVEESEPTWASPLLVMQLS